MDKNTSYILRNWHTAIWKEVLKDCLPITAGVIPFGLTCGIMGRAAGFSVFEITFMSMTVFAGAAQFMTIAMMNSGIINGGVIVFTTLLINLRHLLMGASLSPYLFKQPQRLQCFLAFSMTDESYALTISRIEKKGYDAYYQLGVSYFLYIIWVSSTFLGAFLYQSIPNPLEWGLDFVIPLTFLVLLIPRLINRTALLVAIVSAVIAVFGALYLPGKWYIILAAVVASIVGGLIERRRKDEF
ncbi:AzlC family ABC transporter permease [Clostridium formicaceticum]|uniref:Branched-chain amino acid transporter AzlC n=1 Tax=Clostridium formicaceticum TaxID=1497 RepID=A0AAC9RJK2_9CLOT|nr:AzlC family ABC transporter permease [Clostridium formicaceticum]AOY77694.1 branched-chain amino acid transporter AzlC [Clostridium formicaceticum]ARE88281.1 Inner membrane protein YgaZ [Clostridium formicaceticum]